MKTRVTKRGTGLRKRLKKLNEALPGLMACIAGYGLIAWGIGMLAAPDKRAYSVGLWIGIACALLMAVHMAVTIDESVSMPNEKMARNKAISGSMLRYAALFIALALVAYFEIGSIVAAFIGVMGLKIGAYLQPAVMRLRYGRQSAGAETGAPGQTEDIKAINAIDQEIEKEV